jgi:hypothetical protein
MWLRIGTSGDLLKSNMFYTRRSVHILFRMIYAFQGVLASVSRILTLVNYVNIMKVKQSCPATRHGGAWGKGGIAPTHS